MKLCVNIGPKLFTVHAALKNSFGNYLESFLKHQGKSWNLSVWESYNPEKFQLGLTFLLISFARKYRPFTMRV